MLTHKPIVSIIANFSLQMVVGISKICPAERTKAGSRPEPLHAAIASCPSHWFVFHTSKRLYFFFGAATDPAEAKVLRCQGGKDWSTTACFFVNFFASYWHSKSRMGSLKRCKTQAQIQWFNHLSNAGAHSESLKTYIAFVGPSQALCQAQTGLNRISLVWWWSIGRRIHCPIASLTSL